MATLTGYKAVAVDGQRVAGASDAAGQRNPVFVFDEVVGDNADDSQSSTTPPHPRRDHKDNDELSDASSSTAPLESVQKPAAASPSPTPTSTTIDINTLVGGGGNDTGGSARQAADSGEKQQPLSKQAASRLAPTDATGMSVLSIDYQSGGGGGGGGKSPRTTRRSPLMALFRGKPRESTRRVYSDEDQFEIEWADLSLQFDEKFSLLGALQNCCCFGSNGRTSTADAVAAGKRGPKMILSGVDGRIRSGEITAVLGPSGAGKTSLLNGLFGKYRTSVTGSIKVTGAPTKKYLTVCTIPQSDYLIGYLTTEETLWFASRLKNCEDDFNHDRNIERVIELLGLQRCRHTRINKLSGGQYKRVSIAQEMLSSPDILVLDEPTSGLDSLTCYRTVKVLRDLVEASKAHNLVNPMSIVLTIHQPHREVLDLFHSVYVMAVGGQTLFHGAPSEMEDAITSHSGVSMPAEGYNPASFMVELASEEYGREAIDSLVSIQRKKFAATTRHLYPAMSNTSSNIVHETTLTTGGKNSSSMSSLFNNSESALNSRQQHDGGKYVDIDLGSNAKYYKISGKSSPLSSNSHSPLKDIDSRIMTPRSGKNSDGVFFRHVSLMARRCFLSNNRDPLLFTIRAGAHIFIPLVVALIYGPTMGLPNGCPYYEPEINLLEYASVGVEEIQSKHDDIRIQFQNVGLHFMVYYAFGLCMLAFTAISFPLIMHVLIKEIRNGWYSLGTFIIGKMVAELPMATILPPISVGIIYVMTGQPSSYLQWRYCVQSVILILVVMIAEAKGLVFGALFMNSMQTSVFAASVSTVPFILLSGFLIRIREVPYILQHFAHLSYFKHSVEALIITRYGFGMCPCDQSLIPEGGVPKVLGIPQQFMSMTDYFADAYLRAQEENSDTNNGTLSDETHIVGNNRTVSRIIESSTNLTPEVDNLKPTAFALTSNGEYNDDNSNPNSTETNEPKATKPKQGVFFDKLAQLLTRANAFGYSITSCADVEPFTMKDMQLKDSMLPGLIGSMVLFIIVMKFLSYFIVDFCIKLKL